MMQKEGGWIGVDLDRTLAHFDKWTSCYDIGEPIAPMVERVKKWLSEGIEVRVFTARVADDLNDGREVSLVVTAIQDWCEKHVGARLPVTNVKDHFMIQLWDDRAVQVIPNTGIPVE